MTINLRTVVVALSRLAALFFLTRTFAGLAPWFYLRSIASDDPLLRYYRTTVGVSAVTNSLFFVLFLAFAPTIARWIAPEGPHQVDESSGSMALVGVRLIATAFLVFGLVACVSVVAGWCLQTASTYVSEVWYPEAEIRGGFVRGFAAAAAGIALLVGSRRVARYLSGSSATAA